MASSLINSINKETHSRWRRQF